jgi:hypothetical protein
MHRCPAPSRVVVLPMISGTTTSGPVLGFKVGCSAGLGSASSSMRTGGANKAQPPKVKAKAPTMVRTMWLFILEALLALLILIFIVWWTMFSGRKRGEVTSKDPADD